MPPISHWIVQYLVAAGSMFALLVGVDLARGESFARAWPYALAWALLAAAIFIGSRYRNMKRGLACAACERPGRK